MFLFSVKKDEFLFVKSICRREESGCEGHSSTDIRLELSDFIARSWEVVLFYLLGRRKDVVWDVIVAVVRIVFLVQFSKVWSCRTCPWRVL